MPERLQRGYHGAYLEAGLERIVSLTWDFEPLLNSAACRQPNPQNLRFFVDLQEEACLTGRSHVALLVGPSPQNLGHPRLVGSRPVMIGLSYYM